jgi:hypothetical protein
MFTSIARKSVVTIYIEWMNEWMNGVVIARLFCS